MTSRSGDRHTRLDPRVRLGALRPSPRRVVIASDPASSATFAAQATLALLVDLLARQFGVVEAIRLDVPPSAVQGGAFPRTGQGSGPRLDACLLELASRVSGAEIEIAPGSPVPGDVLVWVGHGHAPAHRGLVIRAFGDGSAAFCSTERAAPAVAPGRVDAIGPHLAACLAADRVFRHFRSLDVAGTLEVDLATFTVPFWSMSGRSADVVLPPCYLVGTGAVGGAYLYTMAASRNVSVQVVGIDPDDVDETSRNRLLLADHGDVGAPKTELARRLTADSGVEFHPNRSYLADYLTDEDRDAPASLRAAEPVRFEYVLSCVDKNAARRDIASLQPRHVLSGSTDGLRAESAYYSHVGPCECLACNHPVADAGLEALAQSLAALNPVERRSRLGEAGASSDAVAAIEDYLADRRCGTVGQVELRRLRADLDGPDWSVGFVSAAAGVLLAARHIALARDGAPQDSEARLYFAGPGSSSLSSARRRPGCDVCAPADAQARFAVRWRP